MTAHIFTLTHRASSSLVDLRAMLALPAVKSSSTLTVVGVRTVVAPSLERSTKVDRSAAYICRQMAKSLSLFVETYGSECGKLTANDITNIVKIEFDCRPGAIAMSLALREPYTKDGIKFFEWENAKDLTKYAPMVSAQVETALKGSNYLKKWVD